MIKLVTDSTCDLPKSIIQEYNIHVVPLTVFFGNEAFKDGVDLTPESFIEKLTQSKIHPKTSQPSPADFEKVYRELTADGSDVISIHISSHLSGTFQSAQIGAGLVNPDKIHIFDSGSASIALAMTLIECGKAIAKGQALERVMALAARVSTDMRIYILAETLEYLVKGGRIGKAAGLAGTLLNIKPILTIKEGVVHPFEKIRGFQKGIDRLAELAVAYLDQGHSKIHAGIAHMGKPENVKALQNKLGPIEDKVEIFVVDMGPVIGAHLGPGTLALCVYPVY